MSNSERTFADRLGRARTMNESIKGFSPVYDPVEETIKKDIFAAFIDEVSQANLVASLHNGNYRTQAKERRDMITDIKTRALLVLSHFKSTKALADHVPVIKTKVYTLRGYRLPRKDIPTNPPPVEGEAQTEVPKTRSTGEQSYSDIYETFRALNALLETMGNYAPKNASISLMTLDTLAAALKDKIDEIDATDASLTTAIFTRKELFDGTDGLRERMLRVKQAVRSQYGSASLQFKAVKGIGL